MVSLALLLLGATPPDKIIPVRAMNDVVVVPYNSPVRFDYLDKDHVAHFRGRFVLTGQFRLECDFCEGDGKESDLVIYIVPDPALTARLPHWKIHNDDTRVFLTHETRLVHSIGTRREHLEIAVGTRDDIHGRLDVIVDDFRLAIDCDSAFLSARYIALAKPPQLANSGRDEGGC
jgi:hypothetical protein